MDISQSVARASEEMEVESKKRDVKKELHELFQNFQMKPEERQYELGENGEPDYNKPIHSDILDGQQNSMSSLFSFPHVYIWPMLCSCGSNMAHIGPMYHKMVTIGADVGLTPEIAMNLVGATRLCCRSTIMSPTVFVLKDRCRGTVDDSIFTKFKPKSIKYTELGSQLEEKSLKQGNLNFVPFGSHDSAKPLKNEKARFTPYSTSDYLEPGFIPTPEGVQPQTPTIRKIPRCLHNITEPRTYPGQKQSHKVDTKMESGRKKEKDAARKKESFVDPIHYSDGWARDENGEIIMTHVGNGYFVPRVRLGVLNMFKYTPQ